jgi:sialate O-acetylesterase
MTAPFRLAAVFGDHMVLQRHKQLSFWGTGPVGASVTLEWASEDERLSLTTHIDGDGRFRLEVPARAEGGPYQLRFRSSETITLRDVWVGEVWLASGQSNMAWTVAQSAFAEEEISGAHEPKLRWLFVERDAVPPPDGQARCEWRLVNPESVARMTAVGYTFARLLCEKLGVAVGIVDASWGGTLVEAWTSAAALGEVMDVQAEREAWAEEERHIEATRKAYAELLGAWERRCLVQDLGNDGQAQGWHETEPGWNEPSLNVPTLWQHHGLAFNGAVWFRREVELPADWVGPSTLHLGRIDDFDHTYVNGELVGAHPQGTPFSCDIARRYTVPAPLLRAGRNVVTVRIFDHVGEGGFLDPPSQLFLQSSTGARVALAGDWQYRVERAVPLVPGEVWAEYPSAPRVLRPQDRPAALFDAMIAPLLPLPLRGVIWYQGESNVAEHRHYLQRFGALIRDWQRRLAAGSDAPLPFLFVQLASFRASQDWAHLREMQARALELPHTGMVVTLDIGDPSDIHPRNKREVGRRLALLALRDTYRLHAGPVRGPVPTAVRFAADEALVEYADQAPLATSDGSRDVLGFEVEADDGVLHVVTARLDEDRVRVTLPPAIEPRRLCYAFRDVPEVNLVNAVGLPAEPFRWPRDAEQP